MSPLPFKNPILPGISHFIQNRSLYIFTGRLPCLIYHTQRILFLEHYSKLINFWMVMLNEINLLYCLKFHPMRVFNELFKYCARIKMFNRNSILNILIIHKLNSIKEIFTKYKKRPIRLSGLTTKLRERNIPISFGTNNSNIIHQ